MEGHAGEESGIGPAAEEVDLFLRHYALSGFVVDYVGSEVPKDRQPASILNVG